MKSRVGEFKAGFLSGLAHNPQWARKQTIADNKLWRVNRDIADFLQEEIKGAKP